MSQKPRKLRKQYVNNDHPLVMLRFEDGHEIKVYQGTGKTFDVWSGENVKILASYDPTSNERELVESRRADAFEDVPEGAKEE
jgi:hypothetical protein